jgi:GxxExxY protein
MLHEDLTHKVIGAALEVYHTLGPGFIEVIYRNALLHELGLRSVSAQTEVEIHIPYKAMSVGKHRLDLVIENQVIVELKAVAALSEVHTAQALSYLKATGLEVALLMNFGSPTLIWKRLIKTKN